MSAQSHKAKGDRNRTQADVAPPIHRVPSSAASSTATAASSVPNSNVASLIQSAARMSLLHDTSSSEYRRPNRDNARQPLNHNDNVKAALFADDEYDNMDQNLQSLRKVTLPAMPDEQDRKRFVVSVRDGSQAVLFRVGFYHAGTFLYS